MKESTRWHSDRLREEIRVVRWGFHGTPVLLFPTAGGDAEECERRPLIGSVRHLIDAGRIKVYSCDSVAGRKWLSHGVSPRQAAWYQNQFDACVYHEVVPAIRADCGTPNLEIVTAGASIGAFNAIASLCRHPDVFRLAVCMSGTYDLSRFLEGDFCLDFYFASPIHFLSDLGEGSQLDTLRSRFVLLATGEGRWEEPEQSWRMAHVLGSKGIPNRVDAWGKDYDHDWPTWAQMLPRYLGQLG